MDDRGHAGRSLGALLGFVVVCHLAGAAGALVTDAGFYRALQRPSWAPPAWLFAPVWLTLYTMMGVAGWLVWRAIGRAWAPAMRWFWLQLALNAAWTPVFFGQRSIGGGLAVILALDVAVLATIAAFRRHSPAASALLVPYACWVAFATALTAALYHLN